MLASRGPPPLKSWGQLHPQYGTQPDGKRLWLQQQYTSNTQDSLHVLKQPDHSLAKRQRRVRLGTAHSDSVPAAAVQSGPRRDTRLNAVGFLDNRALGETTRALPPFAEIKS